MTDNRGRPIESVLGALETSSCRPRKSGSARSGHMARCPAHEDRNRSLSVAEGDEGRVLLHCHAGCETHAIVERLGLTMGDLFPVDTKKRPSRSCPPETRATAHPADGCTLEEYAAAKCLPVKFLQELGLRDQKHEGRPAVRIPYQGGDGEEVAVRYRCAMAGDRRFRWRSGAKPCLYGLSRLSNPPPAFVLLVEGESDTQTLWFHRIPALGLPGAGNWKEEWAKHFDGVNEIHVVVEPDKGGEAMLKWISNSRIRDRVKLVHLDGAKDVSELHVRDPDGFPAAFIAATNAAEPWSEWAEKKARADAEAAWSKCSELARESNILGVFTRELPRAGLVGETRPAKLLFLCFVSRLLDRPVSVAVKGPSSAGKSFLVERVQGFFPPSAYHTLSAMSERALAYSDEPLVHRYLVLFEAAGLQGEFASYLMRSLLSEGKVRYETVEKTKDGRLCARLIERPGPSGLIVTTTATRLHPENETRMLSIPVTDTQEQTRMIFRRQASERATAIEYERWHALQEWLALGELRVVIRFATHLAELVPTVAVRLRRDFEMLLNLIRAHAILHQQSRERDDQGRIVATLDDYGTVRDLVVDLIAIGVEAAVPVTVREAVDAVIRLSSDREDAVTSAALAKKLGLDKSSAWRRARLAIEAGYLRNLEERRGHPARLVLGDPMPEELEILPTPAALEAAVAQAGAGCTVAGVSEG